MVQKLKWNIQSEKMIEIIHFNINNILKENSERKMRLSDLIIELNDRTKTHNVHNIKKYNYVSKYLKYELKGIKNYLDNCIDYGVSIHKSDIIIHLLNDDNNFTNKRITKDSDWLLID